MTEQEIDQIYLNIANEFKKFSKCKFTKVACIAVDDSGKIKGTGVNGTPSGLTNCCDVEFKERDDHKGWSDDNEIHAEMNMILDLARSGHQPSKLSIYTTISPCNNCLKHLIGLTKKKGGDQLIIDKIVYGDVYHRCTEEMLDEMKKLCEKAGIELKKIGEN